MRISPKLRAGSLSMLIGALLCGALIAAGCGNKNKRPDGDLVSEKDPVRGFLATIPADTPFAFVAAEPMPLGPMLSWMDGWAQSLEGFLPDAKEVLADEYVAPETKLLYAVVDELSGNYNVEGFKKLGLSTTPRFALFGIGFLPAIRMDLDDPEAFRAMVQRVEQKSGFTSRAETLGKTDFWSYQMVDGHIVMSIKNRQLLWGFTPVETSEIFTTHLLGETLPAVSMADDDRITPLAKKHGYKRFGAGFVDFARIAEIVLEPGTSVHDQVHELLDPAANDPVPPECLADTKRIVTAAPRMVFGYEEWSASKVRFGTGLELTNDVGKRLVDARTQAPIVDSEAAKRAPFLFAFGFDVSKVLEVFNSEMLSLQQKPFLCAWYQTFNGMANEATAATAWVPAMVTNLRGGAVLVENVRQVDSPPPAMPPDGTMNPTQDPLAVSAPPVKIDGLAVVNSTAPSALLAYLLTLAPEFESVTPDPSGMPVPLPPSEDLRVLENPHVVLTQTSLAITSGAGTADEAAELVKKAPTASPFMLVAYDMARLAKMMADPAAPSGAEADLLEALAIGRTELSLEPRESGIFAHIDMDIPAPSPR